MKKPFSNYSGGIIILIVLIFCSGLQPAKAQFLDPNNTLILNTLRTISLRHNLALQEQRAQTAQMVRQVRQFYDTYTLLRNDIEFSQSLYRDFKAVQNMDLTNSYTMSNFIINGDRLDYWIPGTTSDLSRSGMNVAALLNNAEALDRTYKSFSLSVDDEQVPDDASIRMYNAVSGQQAFSEALFEYALKCQVLAKTYDSMAVELQKQIMDQRNRYSSAERTQLMLEAVKLRDRSNSYYEKYLELSQKAHNNELEMYDKKLNIIQSKGNWKALKQQVNSISKVRYGFFDVVRAPFE